MWRELLLLNLQLLRATSRVQKINIWIQNCTKNTSKKRCTFLDEYFDSFENIARKIRGWFDFESNFRQRFFPGGCSNKIEELVRGTRSNEAQPNYRRQGLSLYLLQIASPPPYPLNLVRFPRGRVSSIITGILIYWESIVFKSPSWVSTRTRSDGNFFLRPVKDRRPEKRFILYHSDHSGFSQEKSEEKSLNPRCNRVDPGKRSDFLGASSYVGQTTENRRTVSI